MKSFESHLIVTAILTHVIVGAYGALGSMVYFLYNIVRTGEKYSHMMLLFHMLIGLFVGILVHAVMMDTFGTSYSGVVLISGFISLKILNFIETNALSIIIDKFSPRK